MDTEQERKELEQAIKDYENFSKGLKEQFEDMFKPEWEKEPDRDI